MSANFHYFRASLGLENRKNTVATDQGNMVGMTIQLPVVESETTLQGLASLDLALSCKKNQSQVHSSVAIHKKNEP